MIVKNVEKSAQKLHVGFERFFQCNSQYVFETSGFEVFCALTLKSRSVTVRKTAFRNKSVQDRVRSCRWAHNGVFRQKPVKKSKNLKLKSTILGIWQKLSKSYGFCQTLRVDELSAGKKPQGTDHFDQQLRRIGRSAKQNC